MLRKVTGMQTDKMGVVLDHQTIAARSNAEDWEKMKKDGVLEYLKDMGWLCPGISYTVNK